MNIEIDPVAKPRMTRRDRWANRPVVAKYYKFCNTLREKYGEQITAGQVRLEFQVPMPKSWSKKKKQLMNLQPHQQRPDIDNYAKAVLDALTDDDSHVYSLLATKHWAETGSVSITEIPDGPQTTAEAKSMMKGRRENNN